MRQIFHAETSIARTEKTPTKIYQVRIQKTSAETSTDIRQNIHAETSIARKEEYSFRDISCQNREDTNRIRIQKAEVETSVDIQKNFHAETFLVRTEKTPNKDKNPT
jgi:hypothetical protein